MFIYYLSTIIFIASSSLDMAWEWVQIITKPFLEFWHRMYDQHLAGIQNKSYNQIITDFKKGNILMNIAFASLLASGLFSIVFTLARLVSRLIPLILCVLVIIFILFKYAN